MLITTYIYGNLYEVLSTFVKSILKYKVVNDKLLYATQCLSITNHRENKYNYCNKNRNMNSIVVPYLYLLILYCWLLLRKWFHIVSSHI